MPNFGIGMQPALRVPGMGHILKPGSAAHAAAFHAKGPDYEIKLFVGGLAFQTEEADLIQYFKQFGIVADAIVMRDRATGKGRGFGFVKMQFANKD
jgi:RNA-binding protein Musashi